MNGFTLLFEALIINLAKQMAVNNVTDLLKISDDKIWSMLDIYKHAARFNDDYSGIEVVGIDETLIARGHKYISLFVDLHKKKTIFITTGKDSQTVADFSLDLIQHNGSPEQIKEVSCDMSPAFIKGVTAELANAKITFCLLYTSPSPRD